MLSPSSSADLPASEVQALLTSLEEDCRKAARAIQADDDGVAVKGGSLVLVDTSNPVHQWDIIADRDLPSLLWAWPWTKSPFED
jgi:2',3'-cyclic-nucleotide 3'-phosphodiesterase